jgi:hypothetical protein
MARALQDEGAGVSVCGTVVNNLRFADDIAAGAESEAELQRIVNKIDISGSSMGLKINIDKTEVQLLAREQGKVKVSINGRELKQVDHYIYLGSQISEDGSSEPDMKRRIGLAYDAMQRLKKVWSSKSLRRRTKVKIYETLVLSILLYNTETWTITAEMERRLRSVEMDCLRKIVGVSRLEHIKNDDIKVALYVTTDIVQRIQLRRLRYFGHVARMDESRYPKLVLHGRVDGRRRRGRPRKRWLDNIKEDCRELGYSVVEAERTARDREEWRKILRLSERALASPRH